ncbi:MAG: dipeptidyl carboxypeptidase II, partial [Candidatus Saccharimonadales bacterium]
MLRTFTLSLLGTVALMAFSTSSTLANPDTPKDTPQMIFVPRTNPFLAPSTLPFQAPAFNKIKDSDFKPAIEAGMKQQLEEVEKIADNPAAPTFENTLVALEKTGQLLLRVNTVFNLLTGANTDPALQKVQEAVAPQLAAHQDAIYLNSKLFKRIQAVY